MRLDKDNQERALQQIRIVLMEQLKEQSPEEQATNIRAWQNVNRDRPMKLRTEPPSQFISPRTSHEFTTMILSFSTLPSSNRFPNVLWYGFLAALLFLWCLGSAFAQSSDGDFIVNAAGGQDGDLTVEGDAVLQQTLQVAGDALLESNLDVAGLIQFGQASTSPGIVFTYTENGTNYTVTLAATRADAAFVWQDDAGATATPKMSLSATNVLTLFDNTNGTGAIVIDPNMATITTQSVRLGSGGNIAYSDGTPFLTVGASNTISFEGAIVAGAGNNLTADNQLLIGAYTDADFKTTFAVGNGTSGQGSNAMEVTSDGDAHVGRDLYVARDGQVNGVFRVLPTGDIGMGAFNDFDSDAQDFFDRVSSEGVTLDLQQREAISTFVESLKAEPDPIWGKLHAVWIFVGNSPSTCALDLKGSHDIDWVSGEGLIFGDNGVTADGIGYGNTGLVPGTLLNNKNCGATIKLGGGLSGQVQLSAQVNSGSDSYLAIIVASGPTRAVGRAGVSTTSGHDVRADNYAPAATGAITVVRDGISERLYVAGLLQDTKLNENLSDYAMQSSYPQFLLARNFNGSADTIAPSGNILQFAAVHEAFSNAEAASFSTALETLQANLGR